MKLARIVGAPMVHDKWPRIVSRIDTLCGMSPEPESHLLYERQAQAYATCRPSYPPALFAYLAGLVERRLLAWDCATGNGQAAVGLANHFQRVVATDAAAQQIERATPHERVTYRHLSAEAIDLADHSVDLVTVAQAVHWFANDNFYKQVRRVLCPGGRIAVWCYFHPQVNAAIDAAMWTFYRSPALDPYWPASRQLVEDRYETLYFPFHEVTAPSFCMTEAWPYQRYADYLTTWPAPAKLSEVSPDKLAQLLEPVAAAWGDLAALRTITWPLHLRVGY